eukprot:Anaeramoba_ignava/a480499_66.p1 GENE.a480499_66~~a480499_66.p1  ORF type:complete len:689 (+),score=155.65 a480499_66:73-2139(+)
MNYDEVLAQLVEMFPNKNPMEIKNVIENINNTKNNPNNLFELAIEQLIGNEVENNPQQEEPKNEPDFGFNPFFLTHQNGENVGTNGENFQMNPTNFGINGENFFVNGENKKTKGEKHKTKEDRMHKHLQQHTHRHLHHKHKHEHNYPDFYQPNMEKRKPHNMNLDEKRDELLVSILNMYPEMDPTYLSTLIQTLDEDQLSSPEILMAQLLEDPRAQVNRGGDEVEKMKIYTEDELFASILEILPDAQHKWIKEQINKNFDPQKEMDGLTQVMDVILKQKEYPRQKKEPSKEEIRKKQEEEELKINYYTLKTVLDEEYQRTALNYLLNEFVFVQEKKIKQYFKSNFFRYAPTYKAIREAINDKKIKTQKRPRQKKEFPFTKSDSVIHKELAFIQRQLKAEQAKLDEELAKKLNEEQYEKEGALIECACCFTDVPLDEMVSCNGGHLFCSTCLKRLVEEAISQRKREIYCMSMDGCREKFSREMIEKAVPSKTWNLYQRLLQEQDVDLAGLTNLKKCPFCEYAVIIDDPNTTVLECKNPSCMKASCLKCGELDHRPLKCEEVERDSDTKRRKFIEEQMTSAFLHECNKCHQKYYKVEGCNKIVCSKCSEIMCYVCGKSINREKYGHFGNGKCPLWSTEKEDDERVKKVEEDAKQKMLEDKKKELAELQKHKKENEKNKFDQLLEELKNDD